MKIHLIADEIFRELGRPSSYSIPSIAFWLRNHIGDLNLLVGTSFAIDTDTISIIPELAEEDKSILKKLFNIYYYGILASQFLGAASQDIVTEVSSDGATVRMVNKNEVSKSYVQLKRDEEAALKDLVKGYNANSITFLQVVGQDTIGATQRPDTNFNRI